MKFNKRYRLTIQTGDAVQVPVTPPLLPESTYPNVVIEWPLTVDFRIKRTIFGGANTGDFTLYNLGESTRKLIFHDLFDVPIVREIIFQAGYVDQNPLPIVFRGHVQVAYSSRRGVDWVTEIHAFDGGPAITGSDSAQSFPAGTSIKDIIFGLMGDLKNCKAGAVGDFPMVGERGASYAGNTWGIISDITQNNGGSAFIDNGMAHALMPGEYIDGIPNSGPLISGDTGLLRAQMMMRTRLDVETIFDPLRNIGQLVQMKSQVPQNNGQWVVKGIGHRGMISGSTDAETLTTLNLENGTGAVPVGLMT